MESGGGRDAPTGCYKCGRPGHWSRDCPSNPNASPSDRSSSRNASKLPSQKVAAEKPKKVPKTRPKLTPELLLSNDGLGFVLRHFPRAFKYRGRGHEVNDLGNLLGLYMEWHSHLIPYYSFNQFVHKVEQVGGTRHVKLCLKELRERIANGGDPTKLHEPPSEHNDTNGEDALQKHETNSFQYDMLPEIHEGAPEGRAKSINDDIPTADTSVQELLNETADRIDISEEQKACIETNRLKALERAAARARSIQSQVAS